ncbi:hypothetical protein CORC01_09967 [Colletotrichum orchidophilum]|uniref:Uncharacterized protein n=1 Tax=Colletotrichum orchidophilum TaxID=1209926 RepID=A0A1G4B000_9PEZI|nr:uncharacterized protein CORC01_09967 [Colletotrichum orchidophilum]OHE94750.1 hypothetical protein CORC01_09967 [Colletotrichum orchidophilum]
MRVPCHHLCIGEAVHAQTRWRAIQEEAASILATMMGLTFSPPLVLASMRRLEPCHGELLGCFDGPAFVGRSLESWSRGQNRSRWTPTSASKAQCPLCRSGILHHHKPLTPPSSSVAGLELHGALSDQSIFKSRLRRFRDWTNLSAT